MGFMTSKYGGQCSECGEKIDIGDDIFWDPDDKTIAHKECYQDAKRNAASPIKPAQKGVTIISPPMTPESAKQAASCLSVPVIEQVVVDTIFEIQNRLNMHGQCKILSGGDNCNCAKCQIDRMRVDEVTTSVVNKLRDKK